MKFISTLLVVKDMEKSIAFYQQILLQEVEQDFGANVILTGGFSLQTQNSWKKFIESSDNSEDKILYGNRSCELYFEEQEFDQFITHLKTYDIEYVHDVKEHRWGQRVVRFYDPDKHIIEVGEKISAVIQRFLKQGLSVEETAKRMDVMVEYIQTMLE